MLKDGRARVYLVSFYRLYCTDLYANYHRAGLGFGEIHQVMCGSLLIF